MAVPAALLSGLAGSAAVTALHESVRRARRDAPRADELAKQVVVRSTKALGGRPPKDPTLYRMVLAGDLASNGLYYSLAGRSLPRALALGAGAGIGAVALPPLLGLDVRNTRRTKATAAMTVAWYTLGGAVAWSVRRGLGGAKDGGAPAGLPASA